MLNKPIQMNDVLNNQQLCDVFLCAPQGGMRKSNRTNTLTLISDKTKLYDDKIIDDIYHYTGMGQRGDQVLKGQNLTLAQSGENGVAIHFFEVLKQREYTYRGQVELAGAPYQERQLDMDKQHRLVWIFPLRLKNSSATFTRVVSQQDAQQAFQQELDALQQVENLPIAETEKERMIKSRIGQGKFKKLLIERECKCALCGVTDPRLLIASHIKPWKDATNEERLDVNNGLLLCPSHDALFDKYLISFTTDGTIQISDSLLQTDRVFMNITEQTKITVNEKQQVYLQEHVQKLK